jgi:hypothetical protein
MVSPSMAEAASLVAGNDSGTRCDRRQRWAQRGSQRRWGGDAVKVDDDAWMMSPVKT